MSVKPCIQASRIDLLPCLSHHHGVLHLMTNRWDYFLARLQGLFNLKKANKAFSQVLQVSAMRSK